MKINYSSLSILFSSFAMILMNTSCQESKGKSSQNADEVVYEASVVKKKQVTTELSLPGELEGYYETKIMAKVDGYVKQILVDIGDKVVQGQVLAILEAPELKSQLDVAASELQVKEAVYINTRGKYARLTQTNKTQGAVSPYDIDLAVTSVKSDSLSFAASRSKFESIKSLVNYLTITAPFDGIITERASAPGSFVGPDDKNMLPILKLKSESRLRLHVAIPEKHIAEIKTGDQVQFTVKSYPEKIFEGKITRLGKNINTQTRSEVVEIEIDNRMNNLLPGMYANVIIPLKRPGSSMVVPQSAIVVNMERSFVIKVRSGNTVSWVDVQKGEEQEDNVEVFGNLNPGDSILNTASDEIKEKSKIKIVMVYQ